ncbi:hypothetical protein [Endozoicomonas euniceicola]|uniref:Uncharacterized protein n=1 Tax=Endozoicomonas euniceicola TaxID=1234143 RepID=A0ABY6GXY0_9GAMM|nr:hypothetical protein [Endozoicomonas euniceicola]UYM17244.1 hypothetical protein NX720_04790 [Endozoicomonas euniceicola]
MIEPVLAFLVPVHESLLSIGGFSIQGNKKELKMGFAERPPFNSWAFCRNWFKSATPSAA